MSGCLVLFLFPRPLPLANNNFPCVQIFCFNFNLKFCICFTLAFFVVQIARFFLLSHLISLLQKFSCFFLLQVYILHTMFMLFRVRFFVFRVVVSVAFCWEMNNYDREKGIPKAQKMRSEEKKYTVHSLECELEICVRELVDTIARIFSSWLRGFFICFTIILFYCCCLFFFSPSFAHIHFCIEYSFFL